MKIKKTIRGNAERPRLVVFRSNRYFYAQVIDDVAGKTLLSVNKQTDVEAAGKYLGENAVKRGITKMVFDRAGYRYHGLVKRFADAVRQAGVSF